MKVEMVAIGSVREYERNPRKNEAGVAAVAASIKRFGFKIPILVDRDGVVVAGHTRLRAARTLGLLKIPVIRDADLSPVEAKAYRIADFDMSDLGFDTEDLSAFMAPAGSEGITNPDDIPSAPDAATTKRGDIWVLGGHRLMCGDSSSVADLDRLLDGAKIHLVNTDPPYNVKVEPRSNNAIVAGISSFSLPDKQGHHDQQRADIDRYPEKGRATHKQLRAKDRPLANDFVTDEAFDKLLDDWFGNIARVLMPGGTFYIWGGYANCGNYPPVLKRHELYFAQAVIWVKEHPVLTRKDFMGNHEWAFYGWREGAAHRFFGPNNVPDVWSVKKVPGQKMVHLTEKPVELARRAIEYSSRPGENVLDLFGGSGSTMMGAELTGRHAFSMELDELYCDVIVARWEQFTGKKAELIRAKGAAEEKAPGGAKKSRGKPQSASVGSSSVSTSSRSGTPASTASAALVATA